MKKYDNAENELSEVIRELIKTNQKLVSLEWSFLRGMLNGLGFFVGSAILAGILIYILSCIQGWAYFGSLAHQIVNFTKKW